MKSVIAFSDSHNHPLTPAFKQILGETDYVFFLGDGLGGLSDLFLNDNFYAVKGNCDFLPFDDEAEVEVEGLKFLLTHGDKFGVKRDNLNLLYRAKELGADCALFGHTHSPSIEECDGIQLINPGSICSPRFGSPSYVYMTVIGKKLLSKIVYLY